MRAARAYSKHRAAPRNKPGRENVSPAFYGLAALYPLVFERASGPRSTIFIIYSLLFILSKTAYSRANRP